MTITKTELQAEIAACYILNEQIRRRTREHLYGFIEGLILGLVFIPVCVLMGVKMIEWGYPLMVGFAIGLGVADALISGICIFFIISCSLDLKKCDKIDLELQEKEAQLKQEPDFEINITA